MLVIALSACGGATPPDTVPDDPNLALAQEIRRALEAASLPADGLEIAASEGEVVISGTAPSIDDVRRILRVASDVRGVRSLVNRVRVVDGA